MPPEVPEPQRIVEGNAGEAPTVIKNLIWLRENWSKHRAVIVVGLILISLAAVFEIVSKIRDLKPKSSNFAQSSIRSSTSSVSVPTPDLPGILSDDDAMPAIEKALSSGDIAESRRLLSLMTQGIVKTNECEHVYGYAKKHEKFEEARSVVELCWEGEEKQKKFDELLHESLKK